MFHNYEFEQSVIQPDTEEADTDCQEEEEELIVQVDGSVLLLSSTTLILMLSRLGLLHRPPAFIILETISVETKHKSSSMTAWFGHDVFCDELFKEKKTFLHKKKKRLPLCYSLFFLF